MTSPVIPFIADLGTPELLIILVVVILLFGSSKLPDLARGSGRALRIFKAETKGLMDDDEDDAPAGKTGTASAAAADAKPVAQPKPLGEPEPVAQPTLEERQAELDRQQAELDRLRRQEH